MLYIPSALHSLKLRLITIRGKLPTSATFVLAGSVLGCTALALHLATRPVSSTPSATTAVAPITVHAAGRGKPFFNFRDGQQLTVFYRGSTNATGFLQSGQAQPRVMTSIILGADAVPDLITGYSANGTGVVTVQHGNPDAFAPKDESVYPRMAQGYNPEPLLPEADTYLVPEGVDFLQAGDFNYDGLKDVLAAARGGDLFLLAGDGRGRLGAATQIALPGTVQALAAGEFRVVDGWTDLAVAVDSPSGPRLVIFDGANALSTELASFPLGAAASSMQFADLDHDPFQDLVVASGNKLFIIHGWSRQRPVDEQSRVERVTLRYNVRDLAVGFFIWNRQVNQQIAVLSDDGGVNILDRGSDTRPYTPEEAAQFHRSRIHKTGDPVDVETLIGWQPSAAGKWKSVRQKYGNRSLADDATSRKVLIRTKVSFQDTDDLVLLGSSERKVNIVRQDGNKIGQQDEAGDLVTTALDVAGSPTAFEAFPQKINGERSLFVMQKDSVSPTKVVILVATTVTVDRFDDPSLIAVPTADDCTGAAMDCSLRGAVQFCNIAGNAGSTINIPAGTYTLSINGTSTVGCEGNSVGDLGINNSTTIVGLGGSGSTIISQHGTNVANAGDRVICINESLATTRSYSISGVTIIGGRDSSLFTAGGIIGGAHDNSLTLNNVVIANNQASNAATINTGGGAIQIVGGHLIINNSTIGGTAAPTTFDPTNLANRDLITPGNSAGVSGGAINHDPSSGTVMGTVGNLTVTSTTFNNNRSSSTAVGGGGVDINNAGFGSGGGGSGVMTFDGCTFLNNQATGGGTGGNGGAIVIESLNATIKSVAGATSFTSNSGTNKGGAIAITGSSGVNPGLFIDGTSANGISFGSNTAPSGSSIFTNSIATLMGTNTTVGGSIYVATNGTWTNNTGSAISPTDFLIMGGTVTCNNSTMNVTGNFTIGPETTKGGILNANTGTINIAGNLSVNLNNGGSGAAGQFNAGTGTFNFNGMAVQTITNSGTGAPITFFNLTDSNTTQTLDVTNSINVSNTLNVNGANAILNPGAAAIIGGTGTLTGTGTARATRTAATADFLTQYTITNKTFTNLTIDYSGAGNQTVNNAPAYSHLRISGSGTKTLQGNTSIAGNLTIAAATLASGNFNFNLDGNWTNNVGAAGFTAGTGTVTFDGTGVVQALSGTTTFFNLTLNNSSSSTLFGTTTTTIAHDLVASAGSMQGDTSTIVFTGNPGSIGGTSLKRFHNLQINVGAIITNSLGDTIIFNDYTNNGTYSQAAMLTTTFSTGADGNHSFFGGGATTFGVVDIQGSNTVDAGSHNFSVAGATFTVTGTFTGNTSTATFNGGVAQAIAGNGTKNFAGLTVNNANGVTLNNGTGAVDASVSGLLTLTTDLTVAASAILQQSGTSGGAADVVGTVRRTDLGVTERSFGNVNNSIQINSGTGPTQMDFNLVKAAPGTFPATVKVVPRDITLTPTGGGVFSATLKLRYIDPGELSGPGITESRLILWKNIASVWTPQGGAVNAASNFVSLGGVTSFSEWAIAEGSDLTLTKANNVSNAAVTGQAWNWTLTLSNSGAPATFTAGQTILTDNLPNSNLNYGAVSIQNVSNITGQANINCAIASNDLTCTASGGSVTFDSNLGASSFDVVFSATPQAVGSYQNPRAGGNAQIDPNDVIVESDNGNNTPTTNTVTVTKASTTTTITSDMPDPSVTGQAVTVQWSVTVNSPGTVGAALTGNVVVSDGTNSCMADVSAGQCDITFTSAGAKSITATYAGDSNYNGSASTPATAHTVNAADTMTTITSDNPDPSAVGQAVTVNFTVTANAPGGGTPTGNVNVTVSGGSEMCTGTVAAGTCMLTLTASGNRTITATYVGDSNFNTSSDTESHDVSVADLFAGDAKVAEPSSGTTNMVFTVTLSAASPGGVTVNFTTADEPAGPGKAVAGSCGSPGADYVMTSGMLTFNAGEQVKTVNVPVCSDADSGEPDETFLLNLSSPSAGTAIIDGTATGTITVLNSPGTLLISELRTSGPGGSADEFVEIYNNGDSPHTVTATGGSPGYGVFKMGADCNATPVLVGTVPNGTIIPARGHYLMVGSTYGLANYGGTGAAAGDATLTSDIENDRNVSLFSTTNVVQLSTATRFDAVGFGTNTGNVCDLQREGTNLGVLLGSTLQYTFFRKECDYVVGPGCTTPGIPKDTNDNADNFLFGDTAATLVAGAGQHLAAPGPQNLASPLKRDATIVVDILDHSVSKTSAPNRVRDLTSDPGNNSTLGTLLVRRRVINNTGGNVTRLRFRTVDITTAPPPGGIADLRARTSVTQVGVGPVGDSATCAATGTPGTAPCTVTVQGLTLETPPAQALAGGYNSTVSAGTITLATPLANGASVNVHFLLGVQQTGSFRYLIIVEALP